MTASEAVHYSRHSGGFMVSIHETPDTNLQLRQLGAVAIRLDKHSGTTLYTGNGWSVQTHKVQ